MTDPITSPDKDQWRQPPWSISRLDAAGIRSATIEDAARRLATASSSLDIEMRQWSTSVILHGLQEAPVSIPRAREMLRALGTAIELAEHLDAGLPVDGRPSGQA